MAVKTDKLHLPYTQNSVLASKKVSIPIAQARRHLKFFSSVFLFSFLFGSFFTASAWAAGDETPPNSDRAPVSNSESFQSSLFTGSFSTGFPIVVPPGTKLQPSLALAYDSGSHGSQTILGAGWNLVGLGSIERSTKKGTPKYDGNGTPPSGSDRYVLNLGNTNDLVYVSTDTSSPYHTAVETYLRINFFTMTHPTGQFSTVYWVVTDKNGTQFRFGFNAGSNAVALNSNGTSKNATRAWYLDKVTDTHGNYIEINYTQDPVAGVVYPSKITYTKNDTSPLNFFRTIDFIYESRPDVITDYSSGAVVKIHQRLKTIDIKINGTLVRQYRLTYKISTVSGRSLFESIQEVGTDAASQNPTTLPPTIFTYQENQAGWVRNSSWEATIPDWLSKDNKSNGVQVVDVNGDSLPDFIKSNSNAGISEKQVWLNNGQGWSAPNATWAATIPTHFLVDDSDNGVRLIDVNGDGKPDFVQSKGGLAKSVWLNNGNGWDATPDSSWSAFPAFFLASVDGATVDQGVQVVDVNADGLPDVVQNLVIDRSQTNKCQLNPNCPNDPTCGNRCDWVQGTFNQTTTITKGVWLNTGNGWGASDSTWTSRLPSEPLMKIVVNKVVANCNPVFDGNIITACVIGDFISHTVRPNDSWTRFLDANGDGLLDLLSSLIDGVGTFIKKDVFLNDGRGWVRDATYSDTIPKGLAKQSGTEYTSTGSKLISLNGNRASDFLSFEPDGSGGFNPFVFLNRFLGWQQQSDTTWANALDAVPNFRLTNDRQLAGTELLDVNGDGLPDVVASIFSATSNVKEVHLAKGPAPDLLVSVKNNSGGQTTVHYKPAVQYLGPQGEILNSNIPYTLQTVDSITTDDGLGHSIQISNRYSGGLYDGPSKEFRGFRSVRTTNPAGDFTETFFKQDNIFKGRVDFTEVRDAFGNLFSKIQSSWNHSTPYVGVIFPFLAQEDRYTHDGATTSKQTRVSYEYDLYGNTKIVNSAGDVAVTGDERIDGVDFVYNDTLHILSAPKRKYTTDLLGNLLSQTWFDYDGQANGTPPTKGDLTLVTSWFPEGVNPATTFGYDAFGNKISVTDARGNISRIILDPLFQAFPITETNAKGQSIQKKYYGINVPIDTEGLIPGLLESVTGLNNVTVTYKYDALGRIKKEIIPPDTSSTPTTEYIYERNGVPPESTLMKKRDTTPNGGGTLDSSTFTDGLGRVIQTKSEAPTPAQQIVVDTVYNDRGMVESVSIPYLLATSAGYSSPQTQPKTITLYDPVGRVIKVTNPDGTYVTSDYFQWSTTLMNANGQKKVEVRDAYGRLVRVEEYKGNDGRSLPAETFALYATTHYQYDLLGNLKKVIDTQGNETSIEYDTLGRKKSMRDPDMGIWSYEYDAVGNLKRQIDAKGQSIYFSYDSLNRLISKGFQDDTQPPTVPASLVATPNSPSKIDLTWTASTDNARVQGYDIFRDGVNVGRSEITQFQDTGLLPNSAHTYKVAALDPAGNTSAQSAPANATTPPDTEPPTTPTNLQATAAGETQINLTWSPSTDAVGLSDYKIERSTNGVNFTEIGTSVNAVFSNTGLSAATTYYYRVKATDVGGNSSSYSNVANGTTLDTTPPSTPTGLFATPINETQINLNWTASTDNVGVTSYQVERSTDGGATWPFTAVSNTNSYSNTGLTFGTTYRYRVKAKDAAGNISTASSVIAAQPRDSTAPSTPVLNSATAISSTQISLSWSASSDAVGVTGYRIKRCTGSSCTPSSIIGTTPTLNFNSTGLSPSTAYRYSIEAYDAAVNISSPSNVLGATTIQDQPPTAPTNFNVNFFSRGTTMGTCSQNNNSFDACAYLSWGVSNDDVGVLGYEIQRCTGLTCTNFAALTTTTSPFYSDRVNISPTGSYRYRVRAYDGANHNSGWVCKNTSGNDGGSCPQ